MAKNILIISSDFTGYGHKSITDSLCEHFAAHNDVKVTVIDGFSLGGSFGLRIGKLYGPLTRRVKDLWKIVWDISIKSPSIFIELVELSIREKLYEKLRELKPDLILSVHPNFNGPVLNVLEDYRINIPFVTLIADLVSITPLWSDPRADYIISPTKEAKYKCIEFGVSEDKIKVMGFPVRSRFTNHIHSGEHAMDYDGSRPLECLIMSGGEGVGNMSRIARILLNNFNCKIKIIAGRNKALKKRLENNLKADFPDRVEIYGFMQNIQDLMLTSDIAFLRGSPNVMMEAVACNLPFIITGALPGQEEGNPGYAQKNNLGLVCKELKLLKKTVGGLLENNAYRLNEIKRAQREFRNPDISKNIADFLLSIEAKGEIEVPDRVKSRYNIRPLLLRK